MAFWRKTKKYLVIPWFFEGRAPKTRELPGIPRFFGEKQELPKMLFLKGKSYYSEVFELSKNKKISFEEYPSITDRNGKILYINKVDTLNIENDK